MLFKRLVFAVLVAFSASILVPSSAAIAADEAAAGEHGDDHAGGDHDGDHGEGDHADGDHADGDHAAMPPILSMDPGAAAVNLAIFLLTFGVLAKFVWPVILGGLKAREDKIRSDLEDAKSANEKAEARLAEYEQKVSEAAAEAQAVLAEARRDAEANATKIVDEAKADAKRQADRALADIETAKKVALAEIAEQTSSLAIGVAKQVVGRELNADDHNELIRNALDQVPSNN